MRARNISPMSKRPARVTWYAALYKAAEKAAEQHPRSFVVLDTQTHRLLGSGADPEKLYDRVLSKLNPDVVPFIYKKVDKRTAYPF